MPKIIQNIISNMQNSIIEPCCFFREEVTKVKGLETRLTRKETITPIATPSTSNSQSSSTQPPTVHDHRDEIVDALEPSEDEGEVELPAPTVTRKRVATEPAGNEDTVAKKTKNADKPRAKKESVMEIIRQNQLEYRKLLTKKIPKLLSSFGISSDSEED